MVKIVQQKCKMLVLSLLVPSRNKAINSRIQLLNNKIKDTFMLKPLSPKIYVCKHDNISFQDNNLFEDCIHLYKNGSRFLAGNIKRAILIGQSVQNGQYRPPRYRNDTELQGFGQKIPSQYSNNNNIDRRYIRNNNSN